MRASTVSIGAIARIRVAVALACLLVAGLLAWQAWQDRTESLARAQEHVRELAASLDLYVSRTLRETETAMRAVAALSPTGSTGRDGLIRVISVARVRHPYLAGLFVLDGTELVGDGEPGLAPLLGQWIDSHPVSIDQLSLGEPVRSDTSREHVVPLAIRSTGADGNTQVVAVAALRASFVTPLHSALHLDQTAASVLIDARDRIVARAPFIEGAVGTTLGDRPFYQAARTATEVSTGVVVSRRDGVSRIWGLMPLKAHALSAAIGIGHDQALAPWRARSWRKLAIGTVLIAVILALGRFGAVRARGEIRALEDLEHSEEQRRVALAALTEGVVTRGADGSIVAWNQAALDILGLSADQLQGLTSMDPRWRAIHEDGSAFPGTEHPAMRALASGEPQRHVVMGVEIGERERRWIEINSMPIHESGRLTGVTSSFVDITEKRLALEKIRNLNHELEERVASRTASLARTSADLEELVYSIVHTMRAPLRHITSFATLLEEDAGNRLAEEHLDLLRRIRESSERQARLVDDLLKYTSGYQHPPVRAHISMDALVDAVIRDTRDRMADAGRVDWLRSPLPRLYGDPAMVSEILEILISNAVKFSARADAPRIEIAACVMDGNPGVLVRDNGVGFDMRFADKLFGMFQRLHEGEGFRGSGIDLAICKRLVERHGGRIEAEGAVGLGATFRFTLGGAQPGLP